MVRDSRFYGKSEIHGSTGVVAHLMVGVLSIGETRDGIREQQIERLWMNRDRRGGGVECRCRVTLETLLRKVL